MPLFCVTDRQLFVLIWYFHHLDSIWFLCALAQDIAHDHDTESDDWHIALEALCEVIKQNMYWRACFTWVLKTWCFAYVYDNHSSLVLKFNPPILLLYCWFHWTYLPP
jgi:hypothetical protein